MGKVFKINENYLYLPVRVKQQEQKLEIFCLEEDGSRTKEFEFMVPLGEEDGEIYPYDYLACLPVKKYAGKCLALEGDFPEAFWNQIVNIPEKAGGFEEQVNRPFLHFTSKTGWINDPNGLVYADGLYHLYFQYNPFNTVWNNMCWGHAVSRDLLHWDQKDSVLFPDKYGMVFSGSGIVNEKRLLGLPEKALLFFYTAAGNANSWAAGKKSTQKAAYSVDNGESLSKIEHWNLETVCQENRDPKVFWHEESRAYVMVLWLEQNDFGIFRSMDLENWDMTDRLTLDGAWECPDLIKVPAENGGAQWMFWSADGFYFWGDFDGFRFQTDGIRHAAYINELAYAAQTYSGTGSRVISVPWLRTSNHESLYRGMMGIPRELMVRLMGTERILLQEPVQELFEQRKLVFEKKEKDTGDFVYSRISREAMEWDMVLEEGKAVRWNINGMELCYEPCSGRFQAGEEEFMISRNICEFSFLIDDIILEVTADYGIIIGMFELKEGGFRIRTSLDIMKKMQLFSIEG